METRNLTVTLEKAKEWYNSGNESLKEVALQAFSKERLTVFDFTRIKTFEDALTALEYTESTKVYIRNTINDISMYSKASAAMAQLNIVRKALNLGQDLHLVKNPKGSYIYFPTNPFITKSSKFYKEEIDSGEIKIIGEIKSEGEEYYVLSGCFDYSCYEGLGSFFTGALVGGYDTGCGFLGCASKEIAQHFGKHFGMLITEAKYGDMVDFEIISDHYQKRSCISTE